MAFSDMMKVTFDDKNFQESITPVLYQMLQPMIEKTIQVTITTAVKAAVTSLQTTVIKDMIQSNQSLQKSVETQSKLIKEQNDIISDRKM